MNDAPIKQPEATTNETRSVELSKPHFDELAVLIAQPVEPIARREGDWFAWLQTPRMMIAILAVAALLGTTALALTLQLPRQRQVESAVTKTKADESQAQPESPLGAITEQLKASTTRRKIRKVGSGETKPVARRIGVIVYGSSPDRP